MLAGNRIAATLVPHRAIALIVVLTAGNAAGVAAARQPLELIPAEHLIAWNGRPLPDLPPLGGGPSTIESLVTLGAQLVGGKTDALTQWSLRAAELFALTIRNPHAFALLDASAAPLPDRPNVVRVADLKMVLAVKLAGEAPADVEPFLRIVQKAVNDLTDRGSASLETRRAGAWTYQELRDRRLPPWCVLAWGRIDDQFVFTLGEGVWPMIAATAAGERPSIAADAWCRAVRKDRGDTALIEVFVAMKAIRERLDPLVGGRATRFFETWRVLEADAAYWALGLEGRALFCEAHFRNGGATSRWVYADPKLKDDRLLALVAPDVRYAIYRMPAGRVLRQVCSGVLDLLGDDERRWFESTWAAATAGGIDVERDLLSRLGDRVLLVNDPPHPLRIPVCVTSLLPIQGDPEPVRRSIDTICAAYRDALERSHADTQPAALTWSLHRDDDGVWYVQYGPLAGPAWTVTPHFVVTSWSPHALRTYLDKMREPLGMATSAPTTAPARP